MIFKKRREEAKPELIDEEVELAENEEHISSDEVEIEVVCFPHDLRLQTFL
jgi:hypothetical protein